MTDASVVPSERIPSVILLLRRHKVMLDADLAALYGVDTRERVQAVKRNAGRFPSDFLFQLTTEEFARLRSQMGSQSRVAVVAARRPMPSPSKA